MQNFFTDRKVGQNNTQEHDSAAHLHKQFYDDFMTLHDDY